MLCPDPAPRSPRAPARPRRPLAAQLVLLVAVCALGLASRRFAHALPAFVAAYAGDTLWALAAFLALGLVLPRASIRAVALAAWLLSCAVEVSQLYHAPWIDAIRGTVPGALLLGFGFLWSDLLCYTLGVALGALGEIAAHTLRPRARATADPPEHP